MKNRNFEAYNPLVYLDVKSGKIIISFDDGNKTKGKIDITDDIYIKELNSDIVSSYYRRLSFDKNPSKPDMILFSSTLQEFISKQQKSVY